ncbi:hypothetical protein Tco_0832562, partial [Tanacetum coccineum]
TNHKEREKREIFMRVFSERDKNERNEVKWKLYTMNEVSRFMEELTPLRFRVDIAEVENASLRATIRTMEAIETVTRNHERQARIKIESQLASVQESHCQDREDYRKLKEFVTSQFEQRS